MSTELINTDVQHVTKQVISDYAMDIIKSIEEGHLNAVDAALRVKFMEDLIAAMKERLRGHVLDELDKYTKGEDIVKYNANFQVKEAGVKYDFFNCNDPEWDDLTQQINELTDQRKDREKFLKTLKKSIEMIDKETGEIITINQPIKSSTTTYSVTWNK
jgi:hypothetical protein